jgi:hypothetical protein
MAGQAPKTGDVWAGAPSGWVSLRALPDAVAEATGADAARVAALLRPMIETGKLPSRPALASLAADENALRSIRVTPGGITYGRVDSDGRPLRPTPPTWAEVFRPASPLLDHIEADFLAAVELVKAAPAPPQSDAMPPLRTDAAALAWMERRQRETVEQHGRPMARDPLARLLREAGLGTVMQGRALYRKLPDNLRNHDRSGRNR